MKVLNALNTEIQIKVYKMLNKISSSHNIMNVRKANTISFQTII